MTPWEWGVLVSCAVLLVGHGLMVVRERRRLEREQREWAAWAAAIERRRRGGRA